MEGGIVLPQFAQAGAFPAAAGFGTRFRLADEVGKVSSDKGGDRLTMTFETEADCQFIGHQLEVGWLLQRDKLFEELVGFRRPMWPVSAPGKVGAERSAIL